MATQHSQIQPNQNQNQNQNPKSKSKSKIQNPKSKIKPICSRKTQTQTHLFSPAAMARERGSPVAVWIHPKPVIIIIIFDPNAKRQTSPKRWQRWQEREGRLSPSGFIPNPSSSSSSSTQMPNTTQTPTQTPPQRHPNATQIRP